MKQHFILLVLLLLIISCSEPTDPYDPLKTMKSDLEFLASDSLKGRMVGMPGEKAAAEFIVAEFEELGLQPKGNEGYYQKFYFTPKSNPHSRPDFSETPTDSSKTAYNVLAFKDNPGEQIIVIGAHYDHLGLGGVSSRTPGSTEVHNGADDNGSGTVGLLHLARILSKKELNSDLLFFAITGEEQGLWGSNWYTSNPTVDLDNVNFMVNMDMVGRLDSTRGLAIYGTGTAPVWDSLVEEMNTDSLKLVKKPSGRGPSDHTSFYIKDIPVLHFFTGQHEDYHKPSDDVDLINYEGILKITDMIERIITELDKEEKLAFQKTKDESTDVPRFTVSLGVMPDYMYDKEGMKISDVSPDKPAMKAGLKKGDVVLQMGDSTIADMMSYMRALSAFKKGDKTEVTVLRGEEELTVEIEF